MFDNMVGIGRVPQAQLDVNAPSGEDALRVRVNGSTQLRVLANTGVTIGGNPGNAPTNGLYVNGFTGMGTTSPSEKLQVNGAIRLNGSASSNDPAAGTIRWNPSTVDFEGYDGSGWKSLTGLPSPPPPPSYQVGDFEDQGVVFFVSPDGKTVKFAHIGEFSNSTWASPTTTNVNGAESTTDGYQNSLDIISDTRISSSAAQFCTDLIAGGHDDWYLPAVNELVAMMSVINTINPVIINNLGDEITTSHWSSTEATHNEAYTVPINGAMLSTNKSFGGLEVRAIRTVTFP